MKKSVIYTVGHSTRTMDDFMTLLQAHGVKGIVDIRSIPLSRHNPQFNADALKISLRQNHIAYRHLKKLGGLRRAKKGSANLGWRNASFRGFADYMATKDFSEGIASLMKIAGKKETAIMCAEAVPWRCHRSLVADALAKRGWTVKDIIGMGPAKKHRLTPFLKIKKGLLTYPEIET
jgi:uncharacterized protein (DUF488 family)